MTLFHNNYLFLKVISYLFIYYFAAFAVLKTDKELREENKGKS